MNMIILQNYSMQNDSALFKGKKQFQSEKSEVNSGTKLLENWCHLFFYILL